LFYMKVVSISPFYGLKIVSSTHKNASLIAKH
jgi:hypothetical protein